jgi:hypothetical protein
MKIVFTTLFLCFSICMNSQKKVTFNSEYSSYEIQYPEFGINFYCFDILPPNFPVLPFHNRLFVPSDSTWLTPSAGYYIQSFCFDLKNVQLYIIKSNADTVELIKRKANTGAINKDISLTYLHSGFYSLGSVGYDSLIIWGNLNNSSKIFTYAPSGLKEIFSDTMFISFVYPFSFQSFVYLIGNRIMNHSNNSEKTIFKSDKIIDGFAIDEEGNYLISDLSGLYKVNRFGNISLICNGVHGLLKYRNGLLFVLWQEYYKIIVIKKNRNNPGDNKPL